MPLLVSLKAAPAGAPCPERRTTMSEYFSPVPDDEELRQGDIIRRFEVPIAHQGASWGFIINADCDLANGKNQGHISWLEIVSTRKYWETFWAPQQLAKFAKKTSGQICEKINSIIKKQGFDVEELSYTKLLEWVSSQEPAEIVSALGAENSNLVKGLEAFSKATLYDTGVNLLDLLDYCQELVGNKPEKNIDEFRKFITRQDGFPDFFLVPNVPDGDTKGYVVLLRRINGSPETDVFKTELDARLNDRPDALHRIGRFRDGIRFQIVQKMSFLYSRIGSPKEFEADCSQVVDWSVEDRKKH